MSSTAPPLPLRERQRRETQRLIRRTAIALAIEHGAAAVSVQSIGAAAGISPRTFFNHFRSKDEALVPDLPAIDPAAAAAFVGGAEPDLLTALEALLIAYAGQLELQVGAEGDPAVMKQLLAANPELLPRVLAVFEGLEQRVVDLVTRRAGRTSPDAACTVAALAGLAAVRAAFDAFKREGGDRGGERRSADLAALVPGAFAALRQLVGAAPVVPAASSPRGAGPPP